MRRRKHSLCCAASVRRLHVLHMFSGGMNVAPLLYLCAGRRRDAGWRRLVSPRKAAANVRARRRGLSGGRATGCFWRAVRRHCAAAACCMRHFPLPAPVCCFACAARSAACTGGRRIAAISLPLLFIEAKKYSARMAAYRGAREAWGRVSICGAARCVGFITFVRKNRRKTQSGR